MAPFHHGLVIMFTAAATMSALGPFVSLTRGRGFYLDAAAKDVPSGEVPRPVQWQRKALPHGGISLGPALR